MQFRGRETGGVALEFFGKVLLEGVNENEFFATAAFVVEPAPFELAFVAEVVDFLDAARDEFGGLGDADPGGGAVHTEADFAIDRRRNHLDKPLLANDGRWGPGEVCVARSLAGWVHRGSGVKGARREVSAWRRSGFAAFEGGDVTGELSENGGRSVKEVTRTVRGPSAGMGRDGGGSSVWAWAGRRRRTAGPYISASAGAIAAGARSGVAEIRESGRGPGPIRKSCNRRFRACLCAEDLVFFATNK